MDNEKEAEDRIESELDDYLLEIVTALADTQNAGIARVVSYSQRRSLTEDDLLDFVVHGGTLRLDMDRHRILDLTYSITSVRRSYQRALISLPECFIFLRNEIDLVKRRLPRHIRDACYDNQPLFMRFLVLSEDAINGAIEGKQYASDHLFFDLLNILAATAEIIHGHIHPHAKGETQVWYNRIQNLTCALNFCENEGRIVLHRKANKSLCSDLLCRNVRAISFLPKCDAEIVRKIRQSVFDPNHLRVRFSNESINAIWSQAVKLQSVAPIWLDRLHHTLARCLTPQSEKSIGHLAISSRSSAVSIDASKGIERLLNEVLTEFYPENLS